MGGKYIVVAKVTLKQEPGRMPYFFLPRHSQWYLGAWEAGSGTGVSLISSRWVSLSDGVGCLSDGGRENGSYCGGRWR